MIKPSNSLGKGLRVFYLHQVDDDQWTCLLKALVITHLRFCCLHITIAGNTILNIKIEGVTVIFIVASIGTIITITIQVTCWRRGSLLSSGFFFVMLAIIEGNSLYICSDHQDHDGDDNGDHLVQLTFLINLIFILSENSLLKKIATLRIVDLAEVGKGKTLKITFKSIFKSFWNPMQVSSFGCSLKNTWLLLMLEMLLTLSSILAISSSDSTWLVMKAKLKRSCRKLISLWWV